MSYDENRISDLIDGGLHEREQLILSSVSGSDERIKKQIDMDRNGLINMYNATCTADENDNLETYESWLEGQLLARVERIETAENILKEAHQILSNGYILQEIKPDTGNDLRQVLNTVELTLNGMENVLE